eukprot:13816485-Ditylum_brightwellii.AAC.1
MKWTAFFQTKNGMIEPTSVKLNKWKQGGKAGKYIRLDNISENKALEKQCESAVWKLGIEFEYTAYDTPQQNSLVESIKNIGRDWSGENKDENHIQDEAKRCHQHDGWIYHQPQQWSI